MTQPRLLVISALDPSAGAGLLMDLKAARAAGAAVVAAVTAITVQGPGGVRAVHPVESSILQAQITTLFDELPIGAIKIGALAGQDNVRVVANILRQAPHLPVVLDPVIKPTRGVQFLSPEAITELARKLLPNATLLTPNTYEAKALSGIDITDEESMIEAARKLLEQMGDGQRWVMVKGGHIVGQPVDVLVGRDKVFRYRSKRRPGEFRGTGCALASAIAAGLSLSKDVPESVRRARRMLIRWMDNATGPENAPKCLRP